MSEHDDFCEAEYVNGAGGYTSCSCDYRRTRGLVAEHDRQVAERAWDACVEEAHALGWLHDFAKSDALARNPHRAAKGEQK